MTAIVTNRPRCIFIRFDLYETPGERKPCVRFSPTLRLRCIRREPNYHPPMIITKLNHTRYRVNNLEQTVKFYKEVLGVEETRRSKSPRGSELVFLKAPQSVELIEICCFPASGPVQVPPDL